MFQLVSDVEKYHELYRDALGFRLSDYIGPATFYHCNPRHHTLAFSAVPGMVGVHHLMPIGPVQLSAELLYNKRKTHYDSYNQFYYLTGFAEPDAVAVLAPGRDNGEYVLFCRDRDREKERWDDPAFVRTQARERFGWVLPGEVAFQVIDENGEPLDNTETLSDPAAPVEDDTPLWWQSAWRSVEVAGNPEEALADQPAVQIVPPKPDRR